MQLSRRLLRVSSDGVTYSIAASDKLTREVGGAGTSCLGGQDVYVIYAAVPGRGVVHAQARYSLAGKERAAELLGDGELPADIIATITQAAFDAGFDAHIVKPASADKILRALYGSPDEP